MTTGVVAAGVVATVVAAGVVVVVPLSQPGRTGNISIIQITIGKANLPIFLNISEPPVFASQ
ncbi:MAG: hypothetical protein WC370_06575 [Dehalococcoidales bacterium]